MQAYICACVIVRRRDQRGDTYRDSIVMYLFASHGGDRVQHKLLKSQERQRQPDDDDYSCARASTPRRTLPLPTKPGLGGGTLPLVPFPLRRVTQEILLSCLSMFLRTTVFNYLIFFRGCLFCFDKFRGGLSGVLDGKEAVSCRSRNPTLKRCITRC